MHDAITAINAELEARGFEYRLDQGDVDRGFVKGPSGLKEWAKTVSVGSHLLCFAGDWRDETKKTRIFSGKETSKADARLIKKHDRDAERERDLTRINAKAMIERMWNREPGIAEPSEYMVKKGLGEVPGTKVTRGQGDRQRVLCVPMYDEAGELWNVQRLYVSGDKKFHDKARSKGLFFEIPARPEKFLSSIDARVYFCEGFATGAAIHEATGCHVVVCFSVGNLEPVLRVMGPRVHFQHVVIASDFDGETFKRVGHNPGMDKAKQLAEKYRVAVAMPVPLYTEDARTVDFADLPKGERSLALRDWVYTADQLRPAVFKVKRPLVPVGAMKRPVELVRDVEPENNGVPADRSSGLGQAPASGASEPSSATAACTLKIKYEGQAWVKPVHNIATRELGFHDVVPTKKEGVKYVPNYQDLRLFFEERHQVVTHTESETIFAWDGKKYAMLPKIAVSGFAEENFQPRPTNRTVAEFFGSVQRFRLRGSEFFNTERKVNFQNGWLDLNKLCFHPHNPDVGFKHVLDYEFDEHATCPEFDLFISRVLGDDAGLVQLVMEYLGYCLSGEECWAAKALVLKGEGANGKSTFLKVVRELVGRSNLSSCKIGEFKSEYSRQRLDGKLVNIAEETPKDALLDSSIFKDIVSGGTIEVRAIYGSPYDLDVRAKLIFSCNDLPRNADGSYAFARRLLIVPFGVTFTEADADPFIAEKLLKELPGIFNKALSAYADLRKRRKFVVPEAAADQLREYQEQSSPLLAWLEEECQIEKMPEDGRAYKFCAASHDLYEDFAPWSDRRGFARPSIDTFGRSLARALDSLGLDGAGRRVRMTLAGKRCRGFLGISKACGASWSPGAVPQY